MRRNRFPIVTGWALSLALLAPALAGTAHAGVVIVPPRPGQVGIAASGLYGTLLNSGDFGGLFASGPGICVRLRYRMRYERAFGLTFEQHGLDTREGALFRDPVSDTLLSPTDAASARKLNMFLYGVDFYQMFDTRTKVVKMLSVGIGIAHPSRVDNDKNLNFSGSYASDGVYVSAGAGVERFVWQSLAVDVGARYHLILHEGSKNHDVQGSIGLVWYAAL